MREARKMMDIMRQVEVMEQKEKTFESAPCRAPLENITNISNTVSRDDSVHEKVGEKRRFHEEDVWVGCDSCPKWRKVPLGFDVDKDKRCIRGNTSVLHLSRIEDRSSVFFSVLWGGVYVYTCILRCQLHVGF